MLRKPLFWIVLAALSGAATLFSIRYFARAFPIVSLDLRMDRKAALERARALEGRFRLGPAGYEAAASFGNDQEAQNFVELEGGGTEAFKRMMADGLYHPFTWTVRHFRPGETREARLRFTPRGDPYGFRLKLPEKERGAALDGAAARRIAEQAAASDWQAPLARHQLVEQSQEVRPGGRVDHTLVYERPDARAGEGRYRLRLVVGGDRLTELTYFLKIPEAFSRRYEEMRSANNVIGAAGSVLMILLYVLGGCGIGLFFLMRRRWVLWRQPLVWGMAIALLQLAASVNQWPLVWMGYDTAISRQSFALQQATMMLVGFVVTALLLVVSFMAAESLTRRAFPGHPQFWRLWSPGVASSVPVLGRTAAGYLLVAVFFAYDVLLYFVTTRALGWWTPSDALVQPDVLATYLPWLSAIAPSAQAGFWEESLFRAVPLAGAALVGDRYGRRGWWIAGGMVVQALIFGSGHAGYANQPAYARVVELVIPSFLFGGLYLWFGLLPGIVLHYTFDVVWFALPLFVSGASGSWLDRALVIVFVFVPLWVVAASVLRSGLGGTLPAAAANAAWLPTEAVERPRAPEAAPAGGPSPVVLRMLPIGGVAGLVLWVAFARVHPEAPPLSTARLDAAAVARAELVRRGAAAAAGWRALPQLRGEPGEGERFVWRTAGRERYRALAGEYLAEPGWTVRFVRFEGDVAGRAEEYRVWVSGRGRAFRVEHRLPEARAGASLAEAEARRLARAELARRFGSAAEGAREISSEPAKLAARTDWLFTFADGRQPPLPQGELRMGVAIAGDEVQDGYRFVHVPEEWQRAERDRRALPRIVSIASTVALSLAVGAAVVIAIVYWGRRDFPVRTFLAAGGTLLALLGGSLANSLPAVVAGFSTAQPFVLQLLMVGALGAAGLVVLAGALGLGAGLARRLAPRGAEGLAWRAGLPLGVLAAGVAAAGAALRPRLAPPWPDFGPLASWSPLADTLLEAGAAVLQPAIVALCGLAAVHALTRGWSRRRLLGGTVLALLGLAAAGTRPVDSVPSWLAGGALLALLLAGAYVAVARHTFRPAVVAVGVAQMLGLARLALEPAYPGARLAALAGMVAAGAATWFACREISPKAAPPVDPGAVSA